MDNLLAVCSTGSGYDMIDVEACTECGIIVCNQSGTNKEAVAEHVFGMLLSLCKQLITANTAMHTEDMVLRNRFVGSEIFGRTLGIVGLGQIGTRVAEIARVFNMQVLAFDPYVSQEQATERGATKTDWTTLLKQSDYITIHCPRNDETLDMFDSKAFATMKKTALFINTARGGIHNENDLADALGENRIRGAGIDVWWQEPTPIEHPLLHLNNVIATPHSAGITHEAMEKMGTWAATQWIDIFAGKYPPRIVNPEAWDAYRTRFAQRLGFTPQAQPEP